ncbi:MAG: amino acid ABC transporter ATP-binding protein [bacterium]|nr:amino acid ABC transporter ATP-binding protein [bacterium]
MCYLEIKDIYKSFNDLNVLNGISMDIEKGEIITIIGSSGNGKTTFLRCLNNLESMDSGVVYLDGKEILPIKEKLNNKHFGLIFQNYNLFPQYSAIENIVLPMDLKAKKELKENKEKNKKERLKVMHNENMMIGIEILKSLGLGEKINYYPHQLSGGQCQRVAIARALALKPDVLCFDEPTSALDPRITKEVTKVIKDLKKDGYTMIIVTHDMDFAKHVSDRVYFMHKGLIEVTGTPQEIFESDNELLKEFLGSNGGEE